MTTPPAGARRRRWPVVVLVLLLVTLPLVGALLGTRSSGRSLDPDNPAPDGARALSQLLQQDGVGVQRVTRLAQADTALTAALGTAGAGGTGGTGGTDGATLVVTDPRLLDPDRLAAVAADAAAVVLLEPGPAVLAEVAPDLALTGSDAEGDDGEVTALRQVTPRPTAVPAALATRPDVVPARCDDPDARAAGEASQASDPLHVEDGADGADAADGAQVCFGGAYGVATSPAGVQVRVFALGAAVSNDQLDVAGNAALALRATGRTERVVWLMASPLDAPSDTAPSALELLPRWVGPVALQLGLVAVAAVVWRARRFGALVTEPLPVVVRSVETARGRAALYRAARDREGAARALRAAARRRLTARLGLPPSTPPQTVAAAVAHAVGSSLGEVARVLEGPAPTDDAALARLLQDVDILERSVAGGARRRPPPSPTSPSSPAPGARDQRPDPRPEKETP